MWGWFSLWLCALFFKFSFLLYWVAVVGGCGWGGVGRWGVSGAERGGPQVLVTNTKPQGGVYSAHPYDYPPVIINICTYICGWVWGGRLGEGDAGKITKRIRSGLGNREERVGVLFLLSNFFFNLSHNK